MMTKQKVPTVLSDYDLLADQPFQWQDHFSFYRLLTENPDPDAGEGFYSRFIFNPVRREYCLQVILYYRIQKFPYHINDFHPFFVYYNDQFNPKYLLYDSRHHYAEKQRIQSQVTLTIRFPWHGYKPGRSLFSQTFKTTFFHLDNQVLRDWWLQPGKPQLKIRSKLVDPWHQGLMPDSHKKRGTFRDEAECPYCDEVEHLDTMDFDGNLLSLDLVCQNGHRFISKYDPISMKMISISEER